MGCTASRHDGIEGSVTGKGRPMPRRRIDDILLRRGDKNLSKKQLLKDAPEDEPSHHNSSEDSIKFEKVAPEPEKSKEYKTIFGTDKDEKIEMQSEIEDDDVESRLSCAEDALVCPRSPSFRFYCFESSSDEKENRDQDEEKACASKKLEKEHSASKKSEIEEEKERSASKKSEIEEEEEEEKCSASKISEIEEEKSKKSEIEEVDVLQTSDEGQNRKETRGRKFKRAMLKRGGKNFLKVKSFYNPACGGHHEKTHLLAPKPVSFLLGKSI